VSRRNPWAILYASLVFGIIFTPYFYLSAYAAAGFFLPFEYADVFWLPFATALLLGVFIVRTPLEQRLADRLGWLFPLMLAALLLAAAGDLMFITLLMMVQFLPPLAEGWVGAIGITAIAAMLVAIIIIVRPPSRLERAITIRLDAGNPSHRAYRAAGYAALLGGLVFASYWFRQYYLYQQYCVGYIEPQDHIDCQPWH
jgi:hypothetical protein